ncbi:hypothetical protein AgCh_018921 [Apium graveolens]
MVLLDGMAVQTHSLHGIRYDLYTISEDSFRWRPYGDSADDAQDIPELELSLMSAPCPLIYLTWVEWCYTDRVTRQFGYLQQVPTDSPLTDHDSFHRGQRGWPFQFTRRNRMHAWIPFGEVGRFHVRIVEGQIYDISNFLVTPYEGNYKCVEGDMHILICYLTQITEVPDTYEDVFDFVDLSTIDEVHFQNDHCVVVVAHYWKGIDAGRRFIKCPDGVCIYERWIEEPLEPRAAVLIEILREEINTENVANCAEIRELQREHEESTRELQRMKAFIESHTWNINEDDDDSDDTYE